MLGRIAVTAGLAVANGFDRYERSRFEQLAPVASTTVIEHMYVFDNCRTPAV